MRKLESGEESKALDAERPSTSSGSGTGVSGQAPEKKMRKKWTMEETQMLVEGCNKVCAYSISFFLPVVACSYFCLLHFTCDDVGVLCILTRLFRLAARCGELEGDLE